MKYFTTFALAIMLITTALAKNEDNTTQQIQGKVTTLKGIACANVKIEAQKSKESTISDSMGVFTITCMSKDKLTFTCNLLKKKSVKIKPNNGPVNVELEFPVNLENVNLAIGYGYIKEEDKTEAIATAKQMNGYCAYNDIYDIFRGRFAGVQVVGTDIIIRGRGSINSSNAALVLVDGVPFEGDLSAISPCDIDNIDIIKDGSASIYGAKGANGAVLIELKKGGE